LDNFTRVSNEEFNKTKKNYSDAAWLGEFDRAYRNDKYAVLIRNVKNEYGLCKHAAIRNLESTEISWKEKQEIKDKIFGVNYVAVEVFPKKSDLIDEANMYHLWILPLQYNFPFNLNK
jgi:hypothetical protein